MMWRMNIDEKIPPKHLMHNFGSLFSNLLRTAFFVFMAAAFTIAAYPQTGGVKGKVRSTSGKGIPNASVVVRQDGKDIKSATADAKGSFAISGLKPGTYSVVFEARGYAIGLLAGVEVKKGIRDLGDRLILAVDRGTLVFVRGSVFTKEGFSLPGVRVDLALINGDGTTRKLDSEVTNVGGEFSFRRPEGPAKLRVTAKYKGVSGSKDIEVDTAAIYRTSIILDVTSKDN